MKHGRASKRRGRTDSWTKSRGLKKTVPPLTQKREIPFGEVYFALCKEINTPVSLGLWLRYKYGEHRSVAEFELPIADYTESHASTFKLDYLAASYLKKFKGLETGIDKEDAALQSFRNSEIQCKATNERLKAARRSPIDPRLSALLASAKRKIAKLLGPCSMFAIGSDFGWSPGATYDVSRRRAQVDTKMTALPITVSSTARAFLANEICRDLHWSRALLGTFPEGPFCLMQDTFLVTDTCRVETVPKSSKTDRVIAIEPTGNIFLQKGIGNYFRRCLKRRGIDLDDQGINQGWASVAQSRHLATLDLKAASDTVSTELVYELLPLDWAFLLDAFRSKWAEMPDGSKIRLNKFSSMGNGFTFELESLIFWALGSACVDDTPGGILAVYGDDLIVSEECALELIRLLQFCGFELNREKSFLNGLFFESCGHHYFGGVNVTPSYQKEILSNGAELIRAHNRLARWCLRNGRDPHGFPPVAQLRRYADPAEARCVVHFSDEADTGFLSDLSVLLEMATRLDANRGARVWAVKEGTRSLPGDPNALLAHKLRLNSDRVGKPDPLGVLLLKDTSEPQVSTVWEGADAKAYSPNRSDNVSVPLPDDRISYGHRWVVTPGFCPLPRR